MADKVNYPVYRKYPNNKTWFKIISADEFEELNITGNYFSLNLYKATILPDRNLIYDLIHNIAGIPVTEMEYEQELQYCMKNLKKTGF